MLHVVHFCWARRVFSCFCCFVRLPLLTSSSVAGGFKSLLLAFSFFCSCSLHDLTSSCHYLSLCPDLFDAFLRFFCVSSTVPWFFVLSPSVPSSHPFLPVAPSLSLCLSTLALSLPLSLSLSLSLSLAPSLPPASTCPVIGLAELVSKNGFACVRSSSPKPTNTRTPWRVTSS